MPYFRLTPWRAAQGSALYFLLWRGTLWLAHRLEWPGVAAAARDLGLAGLYLIGLAWVVWVVERSAQRIEGRRLREAPSPLDPSARQLAGRRRSWNPLDPAAWYYGRHSQRLRQSLAALAVYTAVFIGLYLLPLFLRSGGAAEVEPYELPAGGGQDLIRQSVRVQKVQRKKLVINPYSSIKFNPPPLETIDVKLLEESQNLYQVGQGGDGEGGAGFGAGTKKGRVRFIRLKHSDKAWDKNYGKGGDMNLLAEYGKRLNQPIAEQTEYIEIAQLAAFPERKSPPVVFVAGAQTFQLSVPEKKILQQYLLERHGMIFADNLGGPQFHAQFVGVMREILPQVDPVMVPRDDYIHRRPYGVPEFPFVVAHYRPTAPLGWKVDGRWVAYYHPGAISDAWRDDHAGIKKAIWEECYQLGINVMFYAHAEYSKWLLSQAP